MMSKSSMVKRREKSALLFSLMMALAVVIGALLLPNTVQTAEAATVASGTCGANLTWTLDYNAGTLTISGTGAMNDYTHSYSTGTSNMPWYNSRGSIKTVRIDKGVTSIGSNAFYQCSSLRSITIPDSVTSIGSNAFYQCSSLRSITIPDSVTSIGGHAFYQCSSLTSITIPDSVTSIRGSAFRDCTSLRSVTIPDSVTSIGDYAFYNCDSLTSVTIPGSVTSIWNYAFSGCARLTSVTIPDSVTSIGSEAFSGCGSLTGITIPGSVRSIEDSAFATCRSLTSVSFTGTSVARKMVRILPYTQLKTVTIGDSVTSIEDDAFAGCSMLTGVYITDFGAWCGVGFGNSSANPLYYAHNLYLNGTLLTEAIIPDSMTSIGSYAFYNCSNLTSITIPDSVTSIGSSAFYNCTGLTSVYITDLGAWYGISFSDAPANPLCYAHNLYLNGKLLTEAIIPDSVTSIGFYTFYGCSSLTSVTIGSHVRGIGNGAFGKCTSLTSITIPGSVTGIQNNVFYGCTGLTSVTIPDRVTFIGSSAFYNCTGLTSVTIPGSVTRIGDYAFQNCTGLTSITIPDSVTSIGRSAFSSCTGLRSVTIPDSVTSIAEYAFYNCDSLTSVTIPGSVTSIGSEAFSGCTGLTSVTIPCNLTSMGDSVFSGCSKLTSVTFTGTSVTKTMVRSLPYTQLQTVIIGDSVTSIGDYAFENCTGLTSVTIGSGVTHIGKDAFNSGGKKKSIIIMGNLELIGERALCSTREVFFLGHNLLGYNWYQKGRDSLVAVDRAWYPIDDVSWDEKRPYGYYADGYHEYSRCSSWAGFRIDSISIHRMPEKVLYLRNEQLITDDLILSLNTTAGEIFITSGYTISGFDSKTPGQKTVTMAYGDKTTTFTVTVAQPILQSISVNTMPNKLIYERNEALDTAGLTLTAVCNDGTDIVADGYTADYDFSTPGEKTVTVSYGGKTTSFTVTVKVPVWNAIAVTTPPDKTMYEMNEALDTTGLAVSKVYSDKSSELITEGYEVSGFDSSTWGNKTVTVSYSGMSTTFTVYVGEPGDLNGNGKTTDADAIYLLMHTFFPEDYPVSGDCDYNGDGKVTDADAIYLLMYTFFPEDYPLVKPNKKEELI